MCVKLGPTTSMSRSQKNAEDCNTQFVNFVPFLCSISEENVDNLISTFESEASGLLLFQKLINLRGAKFSFHNSLFTTNTDCICLCRN